MVVVDCRIGVSGGSIRPAGMRRVLEGCLEGLKGKKWGLERVVSSTRDGKGNRQIAGSTMVNELNILGSLGY